MKAAQKKKILFVMQMPPPVHGVSVMNQLIRESDVINEALSCHYVDLATAKDISDLQKNRLVKYFSAAKIVLQTTFRMLTNRYDYVYVTIFPYGFSFIKDSFIVLLAKLFGHKPMLHLHTYGFKENAGRSARWHRYYKFVFKNTELICLSDLLVEDVERIYNGPVYILPNGIPKVNGANTYNNSQSPLSLLFLSNLFAGKGILILLEALAVVKKKGYAFRLRIVGQENEITYQQLGEIVNEAGLSAEVDLVGPRFEAEKYEEYKKAGLFVFPTDYDTFGLVLLEAMQFGVPCISTHMGAIPDLLGDGSGLIVPGKDAAALSSAIIRLLESPQERGEMSKKAFDHYNAHFTKEKFEQRLKNILIGKPDKINTRLSTTTA